MDVQVLDVWKPLNSDLVLLLLQRFAFSCSSGLALTGLCHCWNFLCLLPLDLHTCPMARGFWYSAHALSGCLLYLACKFWCKYSPLLINIRSCPLARLTRACKAPRCTSLQMIGRLGSPPPDLVLLALDVWLWSSYTLTLQPVPFYPSRFAATTTMKYIRLIASSPVKDRVGESL